MYIHARFFSSELKQRLAFCLRRERLRGVQLTTARLDNKEPSCMHHTSPLLEYVSIIRSQVSRGGIPKDAVLWPYIKQTMLLAKCSFIRFFFNTSYIDDYVLAVLLE